MYIDVPWGEATVPVKLDRQRLGTLVRSKTQTIRDEAALLRQALQEPVAGPSFREFLDAATGRILILVNDGTRPTPTAKVLQIIGGELEGRDVSFLVATGAHRAPAEDDLEQIFGRDVRSRYQGRIEAHDARNADDLAFVETTSRGTPVYVNRRLLQADRVVVINSVEPHYFAGYTGGRKSIFPGVAGFETIEANHKLALDPAATILALKGNPVHEDMLECIDLVGSMPIFSIQMVLDHQHRLHSASAGSLPESFAQAVHHADAHYVIDIDRLYDVVVTVAPHPMDYDLYQSQKAMENGAMALMDGGVLILVSTCRHGIGDETFFNLLATAPTPQAALRSIEGRYVLGYHKAARLAHIAMHGEMWGVTGIPAADLEAAFIRPFPDVQSAVDAALNRKGPSAQVLFLMDGSVTVPRLQADVLCEEPAGV